MYSKNMSRVLLQNGIKISQIVLTIIQNDEAFNEYLLNKDAHVDVYAMQNGREQGFSYVVSNNKGTKFFTWTTYEHRNSDELILNGKAGFRYTAGDLPYTKDTKYGYISSFNTGEYDKLAEALKREVIRFLEDEE